MGIAAKCQNAAAGFVESWRGIVSVGEGRGANKFSAHVPSQSPNHPITTASSWFVGREEQREVIRDCKAIRLQSHTTVGIVFNQARMFLALSKHDCGHTSERVAGCASSLLVHALTSRLSGTMDRRTGTDQSDALPLFWFPFGCPSTPTVGDAGPSILTKRNCQSRNEFEI